MKNLTELEFEANQTKFEIETIEFDLDVLNAKLDATDELYEKICERFHQIEDRLESALERWTESIPSPIKDEKVKYYENLIATIIKGKDKEISEINNTQNILLYEIKSKNEILESLESKLEEIESYIKSNE